MVVGLNPQGWWGKGLFTRPCKTCKISEKGKIKGQRNSSAGSKCRKAGEQKYELCVRKMGVERSKKAKKRKTLADNKKKDGSD